MTMMLKQGENGSDTRTGRAAAARSPAAARLVGHGGELREILELLDLPGERLLTLTGFAGVGKSTLARCALGATARPGLDRLLVLEMSDLADDTEACDRLSALVPGGPAGAVPDVPPGGRLLVLVDDCDVVVPGVVAGVLRLLAARPEAAVVCASRLPLDIRAEHIHPVHPLSLGPDGEAVRLFTERVSPHYRHVVAAEQAAVVQICEHAEGIPLVVEWAAEAVGPLTPRELLHRLRLGRYGHDRRLRDLPERHRSIDHALAWGEAALTAEETELLKRLSVCDAPVDVATARRLLGTSSEQTVLGLGTLVHKSLLMSGAGARGDYHFTMPRVIRDHYRRELAQEPQVMSAVRGRHAATTMALLAQVRRDLRASTTAGRADRGRGVLATARSRTADVHAAVRHLRDVGEHAEALRLLTLLEEPLLRHGLVPRCTTFEEYLDAVESAAQRVAERPQGRRQAAEAMVMVAGWAMTWGRTDRARSLLAQAEALGPPDAPGALAARVAAGRCELL
ncbi:hypothetical protein HCN56_14965, partial [Streptomyces lonarensis]|nr:hypothetical protein [Streptomyces lonarensis]